MKRSNINMVEVCLAVTPMQKFIKENEVLGQVIYAMYNIPFETIKLEECMVKNREELIRRDKDTDEPHVNVYNDEKFVYICRILKAVAIEQESDLLILDGYLYYFNRKYWEKIIETVALDFVAMAASKSGFLEAEAQQEGNKKKLLKQLVSDAVYPPNRAEGEDLKILINFKNGTLEYNKGTFIHRGFQKEDMLRYQLSFEFDSQATCPKFDAFLDEVLPEKAAQDVLMEMIGYCFIPTRKLKLERSMMLYGEGANGKGVIYELVKEILGKEHVSGFTMGALSHDANTRAQLSGKLLNYSSELGGKCNPDMIKKLISGEDVEVKTLYKDVSMLCDYTCKFMFNTNSLPKETESNIAFFRRWIILPFNIIIPKERRNVKLSEELKKELPGIFNLVIEGIKRLLVNEDFTESELAEQTKEEYEHTSSTLLQFIQDEGWVPTVSKDNKERLSSEIQYIECKFLFKKYMEYCSEVGSHNSNYRKYTQRLRKVFYVQTGCRDNQTWVYCKKKELEKQPTFDIDESQSPIQNLINQMKKEE